jgi:hypothetical protein
MIAESGSATAVDTVAEESGGRRAAGLAPGAGNGEGIEKGRR